MAKSNLKTSGHIRVAKVGPKEILGNETATVSLIVTRAEAAKLSAFLNAAITKTSTKTMINMTLFKRSPKPNDDGYHTTITWSGK